MISMTQKEKEVSENLLARMEKENTIKVLQWKNATQDIQITREEARQQGIEIGKKEQIKFDQKLIDIYLKAGETAYQKGVSDAIKMNEQVKKEGD